MINDCSQWLSRLFVRAIKPSRPSVSDQEHAFCSCPLPASFHSSWYSTDTTEHRLARFLYSRCQSTTTCTSTTSSPPLPSTLLQRKCGLISSDSEHSYHGALGANAGQFSLACGIVDMLKLSFASLTDCRLERVKLGKEKTRTKHAKNNRSWKVTGCFCASSGVRTYLSRYGPIISVHRTQPGISHLPS